MTVTADMAIIHFGEFFRRRVFDRGRVQEVFAAAGLNSATGYRFFRASAPEPLRIEHYNKVAAAKAAGFATWEELDAAWRVTKVVPVERRSVRPSPTSDAITPRALLTHAQLAALADVADLKSYDAVTKSIREQLVSGAGILGKIESQGRAAKSAAARAVPEGAPIGLSQSRMPLNKKT